MNFAVPHVGGDGGTDSAAAQDLDRRRLTNAAQQFEGMLLQELLRPMRGQGFCGDESQAADRAESGGDTLASFGTEVMATAIAKSGGLGIAQRVIAQIEDEKWRPQFHLAGNPGSTRLPK